MNSIHNPKLTPNAKVLRKNMTKQERHLWYDFLKNLPVTIHRQKTIGNYIVDFYCASARLVIEIDGARHFTKEGKAEDLKRDTYLKSLGLAVMRFSNSEIEKEFKKVSITIVNYIKSVLADA